MENWQHWPVHKNTHSYFSITLADITWICIHFYEGLSSSYNQVFTWIDNLQWVLWVTTKWLCKHIYVPTTGIVQVHSPTPPSTHTCTPTHTHRLFKDIKTKSLRHLLARAGSETPTQYCVCEIPKDSEDYSHLTLLHSYFFFLTVCCYKLCFYYCLNNPSVSRCVWFLSKPTPPQLVNLGENFQCFWSCINQLHLPQFEYIFPCAVVLFIYIKETVWYFLIITWHNKALCK